MLLKIFGPSDQFYFNRIPTHSSSSRLHPCCAASRRPHRRPRTASSASSRAAAARRVAGLVPRGGLFPSGGAGGRAPRRRPRPARRSHTAPPRPGPASAVACGPGGRAAPLAGALHPPHRHRPLPHRPRLRCGSAASDSVPRPARASSLLRRLRRPCLVWRRDAGSRAGLSTHKRAGDESRDKREEEREGTELGSVGPARVGECDIGSRQGCRPPAVLSPPCMKEKMMWSLIESLTTSIAGALRAKQSA